MTALERAQTYAAIFIKATRDGRDWRKYVPVDGRRRGDVVEIGGVRMQPAGDGWMLTDRNSAASGNRAWRARPAEEKAVKVSLERTVTDHVAHRRYNIYRREDGKYWVLATPTNPARATRDNVKEYVVDDLDGFLAMEQP